MLCENPFSGRSGIFGCSQCLPCRINRARLWTHRILLEQAKHTVSSFVSLSYDEDHIPLGSSLQPKDTQDWLKRFRRAIEPQQIRYFLVGEYGDRTWRPHYHVALFGYQSCLRGRTDHAHVKKRNTCCKQCDFLRSTWGNGAVDLGELNSHSAQYVAGYVTKKMNGRDQKSLATLAGRHPEFARMSLRPGIGASAMVDVADELTTEKGSYVIEANQDVPSILNHAGKSMPLGRYLRSKLRKEIGGEEKMRAIALQKYQGELRELSKEAQANEKFSAGREWSWSTLKEYVQWKSEGKIINMKKRAKIFQKKGSL